MADETGWYHVSSSTNRESIATHGLDPRRMGAARGIAGSRQPEREGCFLARGEAGWRFFVDLNSTGGPVDVWRVRGVEAGTLVTSLEGFCYFPGAIPADRVELVEQDAARR
ncbi:hypothetical protein GCM10023147_28410 [Tsukamurella soli]|uniref:Uncharacterized protein n=1 Tax=Tsukamurella soli TaxID=644556 RepID=A0ABP8JSD6_9ACTN